MRIRFLIVLTSALVLGAVAVGILLNGPEPHYEGRSLSDWIVAHNIRPGDDHARWVIHRLGSNSIPVLLEWLQREDRPTLKGRIAEARTSGIAFLERHRLVQPRPHIMTMDWKSSYRALAIRAFEEIGPEGKEAIPALVQMLGRKSPDTNQMNAAAGAAYVVLGKMAPVSIPPLIDALSSTDFQVWALAASALSEIGPEARAAIPALQKRLADKNPMVRVSAARAIGKLGGAPGLFMPTVIQSLCEPDFTFLDFKLEILLSHKDDAKAAVPVLLNLLTNAATMGSPTNAVVRDQVRAALRQLDPDAAARAGVE